MKKSVSLSVFILILQLLNCCTKTDIPPDYSTIQVTGELADKFYATDVHAWSTPEGITISIADTIGTRFIITIPGLDKSSYTFNNMELIRGEYRMVGVTTGFASGFGVFENREYYIVKGSVSISDTTGGSISATYKIYGLSADINKIPFKIEDGFIKNVPVTKLKYNTVSDYEGNSYMTIKIGNQEWMAQNLKATRYSDGTQIKNVMTKDTEEELISAYGRYYTWDAAMNNKTAEPAQGACPAGWHIPSDNEWKTLTDGLGGEDFAGVKLVGTKGWWLDYFNNHTTLISNSYGFTARLAGYYRWDSGLYSTQETSARFWTSSSVSAANDTVKYSREVNIANPFRVAKTESHKKEGNSIRCIRDN